MDETFDKIGEWRMRNDLDGKYMLHMSLESNY